MLIVWLSFWQIDLKFEHPFYGIVYADFDRSSSCSISGNGTITARIDLPLKGCGTLQVSNIFYKRFLVKNIRFEKKKKIQADNLFELSSWKGE